MRPFNHARQLVHCQTVGGGEKQKSFLRLRTHRQIIETYHLVFGTNQSTNRLLFVVDLQFVVCIPTYELVSFGVPRRGLSRSRVELVIK
jgi:hypothetical protein